MGCDAYANDIGEFKLEIRSYDSSEVLRSVKIEGLAPGERIAWRVTEGESR